MNIKAYYEPCKNGLAITLMSDDENSYVNPNSLELKEREGRFSHIPSTTVISMGAAQRLADQLWDSGIRPSKNPDESEKVCALRLHLEDLRYLCIEKDMRK